jgi:hypothetical protein
MNIRVNNNFSLYLSLSFFVIIFLFNFFLLYSLFYNKLDSLRQIEEEIGILKSKKGILNENINFKIKQKKLSKKNIEGVLLNLENQLDKYDIEEFSLNRYRKDITNINNRMKNILSKENMIFRKNKIKM